MLVLPTTSAAYRLGFSRLRFLSLRSVQYSTLDYSTPKKPFQLVPFKSISADDLGRPILCRKVRGGVKSVSDVMNFGIKCAKFCSLGSSALGIFMIPVLSSALGQGAAERPSVMAFVVVANAFLGLLTLTPLLLHSLTKRFVVDVYYNYQTQLFTTVHYNFLLQKRALQFQASDVVLAEKAEAAKKLWIPLATVFVDRHPLLLLLDPEQYSDKNAFNQLTSHLPAVEEQKDK
ncbi:hypothetical protein M3Y98_01105300 [Aphelenchoides besseyi]|nr:hypothetical protein M3Y98_01105300 [Aphelenchoides besseyi]KAI6209272.1 hypothetical protein M3Y96_00204100 [Aphelenchoides besseyi]